LHHGKKKSIVGWLMNYICRAFELKRPCSMEDLPRNLPQNNKEGHENSVRKSVDLAETGTRHLQNASAHFDVKITLST